MKQNHIIAINKSLFKKIEASARKEGISTNKIITRALSFYLGSKLLDTTCQVQFYRKIEDAIEAIESKEK